MRPDFWLAQVQTDRYSLTPCSPLGKREFPDIQLGKKLGDFLMLSHDESQFLLEAWGPSLQGQATRPQINRRQTFQSAHQ